LFDFLKKGTSLDVFSDIYFALYFFDHLRTKYSMEKNISFV